MATQSLPAASERSAAAAALAKRAMTGRQLRMEKAAAGSDPLGVAFDWIQKNPGKAYPLLGAAGGAAMGGLLDLRRKKEERTPWASMTTGALAGGGLGLGAALLGGRSDIAKAIAGRIPKSWYPTPTVSTTSAPWAPALGQAALKNIPEAGVAAGGWSLLQLLKHNPTRFAFSRSLATPEAQTLFDRVPGSKSVLQGLVGGRRAAAARAGSAMSLRSLSNAPAVSWKAVPPTPGPPMGGATGGTSAGSVSGPDINTLLKAQAQQMPGRFARGATWAQRAILPALLGKLLWDARNMHSVESAKKAVAILRLLKFSDEEIIARRGMDLWRLAGEK